MFPNVHWENTLLLKAHSLSGKLCCDRYGRVGQAIIIITIPFGTQKIN